MAPIGDPQPNGHLAAAEGGSEPDVEALEARLERDEQRLAADERILVAEVRELRSNRTLAMLAVGMAVALAVAVVSLIVAIVAVNRDVESVAKATPKDHSVGTSAIQDGAVTSGKIAPQAVGRDQLAAGAVGAGQLADGAVVAAKLAPGSVGADRLAGGAVTAGAIAAGAVGPAALAPGSVGGRQLAAGAVTGAKVATNSLTGANIDEGTLGGVRRAAHADTATAADSAKLLDGLSKTAVLSRVTLVHQTSATSFDVVKGPIAATCPSGTRVIGGGAGIRGTATGVAIVRSEPRGDGEWVAAAEEFGAAAAPWRLVVTAICAAGGR